MQMANKVHRITCTNLMDASYVCVCALRAICVCVYALLLHMLNNASVYKVYTLHIDLHLMILIFNANTSNCGYAHIYLQTF